MTKMNWQRASKLYRRMTTDHRSENEIPDRAQRWLRVVEGRQQWQRAKRRSQQHGQHTLDLRRPISVTANSSELPW